MDKNRDEQIIILFKEWVAENFSHGRSGTEYNMDDLMLAFIAGFKAGFSEAY